MTNTEKKAFDSFNLAYIGIVCKLPTPQDFMRDNWIKDMDLDVIDYFKKMMLSGMQFLHKNSGEYEIANLCILYHLITLMLNCIFGWTNEKFYKVR